MVSSRGSFLYCNCIIFKLGINLEENSRLFVGTTQNVVFIFVCIPSQETCILAFTLKHLWTVWFVPRPHTNLEWLNVLFILSCRFGAVFLWDSGSSVGDIAGHSKSINSVDIRQKRPYRLVTASEDSCATFSEGPPFKFKFTLRVSLVSFFTSRHWSSFLKVFFQFKQS